MKRDEVSHAKRDEGPTAPTDDDQKTLKTLNLDRPLFVLSGE